MIGLARNEVENLGGVPIRATHFSVWDFGFYRFEEGLAYCAHRLVSPDGFKMVWLSSVVEGGPKGLVELTLDNLLSLIEEFGIIE